MPRWRLEIVLFMSSLLLIQNFLGAYRRDFHNDSDEAAHFVSGVMVHDYLTSAIGAPPLRFAEEYYLRYSKVAIGHWPPGFYVVQGIWYSLVGVSKTSATFLSGLILAGMASCLFRRLSLRHEVPVSLVTVAVFLGQPMVLSQSILFMSDMLACLGTVLAVFAFSDFLESPGRKHAATFALWSSFAILTRPSALALAAFVPICLVVSRRLAVVKDWRLWIAGAAICILTAPYYLWTWSQGMGLHTHGSLGRMIGQSVRADRSYHATDGWLSVVSGWLVVISVVGCLSIVIPSRRAAADRNTGRFDFHAAIALCCATVLFLFAAPVFSAQRYFLPFVAGMMIFYARGLETLLHWLPGPKPIRWAVVSCLAVIGVVTAPGGLPTPSTGFAAAAESFGAPQPGRVTMISSDSRGEGAFVVERLLRDRSRSEFVLRASKVLAESNWSGKRYRSRFSTRDEMSGFLNSIPVHFIVVADFGYRVGSEPPHHELLKELMLASPEQYPLVGTFSVTFQGRTCAICVYENRSARGRLPVRIDLDMQRSLGRALRFESQ